MPPPCFQRPWRSISWVEAPFWTMRRAMPTCPLWPLKNSQFSSPTAWAMAFTRRAIWDSDSRRLFRRRQPLPAGLWSASRQNDFRWQFHLRQSLLISNVFCEAMRLMRSA